MTGRVWCLYVESKKKRENNTNELIYKTEKQTHSLREWIYGYRGEGWGGRDRLGVWDWHVHTAILKIDKINNYQGPTVGWGW